MQVAELFAKLGLQVDKKSWSVGNDVIAGLGKALAVFVGYKVVKGIGGMIGDVIELGSHLNDLSQATGQNVETLQELGYVAKLNSSSTEELGHALGKLSRNMYAAAHGGEEQAKAFGALGIKVTDSTGHLRASEDVLLDLSDRFSKMPDGPQKTAEAMSVLGRSGASLIPTLNTGRAGIEQLREEFKALGGEIKSGDISKLDDLGDNIDRMKVAWQGIKNQVVIALVPVLKDMANGLLGWIKANRELITSKIKSFVEGLAGVITLLARAVAFMIEHWQIFAAILAGVGIVTGLIRLIKLFEWLGLASTRAAARTLVAWAVAAAPFVIIAAALAALVYAVLKYRKQAREVFNWIAGKLADFLGWFASLPGKALSAIKSVGTAIKDAFTDAFDWARQKADEAWEYIKSIPGRVAHLFDFLGSNTNDPNVQAQARAAGFGYLVPDAPRGAGVQSPRNGANVTVTNGPLTVQVVPGASPEDYAEATRKAAEEHWNTQMNHALADSGEED